MTESKSNRDTVEVLAEEFVARLRRGERPSIDDYVQQYPDHAAEILDLFPAMEMVENLKLDKNEIASSARSTSLLPLSHLGDYRIIREIGRGGMGVVYQAEQVSLGRTVALKVLAQNLVNGPKQKQRFEREARAAARLHHTNIVPVFGVGSEGDLSYYVMQFIQGQSLDRIVAEWRAAPPAALPVPARHVAKSDVQDDRTVIVNPLSPVAPATGTGSTDAKSIADMLSTGTFQIIRNAADSGDGVGSGRDAHDVNGLTGYLKESDTPPARSKPVIRDATGSISTSNAAPTSAEHRNRSHWTRIAHIGVQVGEALDYAHGQGVLHRDIKPSNLVLDLNGRVWVTDFGLARLDDDRDLTGTGEVLGTLRYMAPEVFKGQTDARSEIYALGLTLYELLTLKPAFGQHDRNTLLEQIVNSRIEPLSKINAAIPADLQTIIHKSIDADPQHRYQSGREFADDLQRFIDDEPILARRTSSLERLSRWTRRNRGLASLLSVIALLVTSIAVSSTIAAGYFRDLSGKLNRSVDDLTANAKELFNARNRAEAESDKNLRLADEAETARQASQTMLADMQTEHGFAASAGGNKSAAMLWFANAASLTPHDPGRQRANRLRARNWMNESYLPIASFQMQGKYSSVDMAFQPNGELLLVQRDGRLQIWNVQFEQSLAWADELSRVTSARWSPDGGQVAISFSSGEVHVREAHAGTLIKSLNHADPVESLAYSNDGSRLATGGQRVRVWNMSATPVIECEWSLPASAASLKFNRQGSLIAMGCRDGHARVFKVERDARDSAPLFAPVPHKPERNHSPIFVDGGQRLITTTNGRPVWRNALTGVDETPASLQPESLSVLSMAASPDERWCAVGSVQRSAICGPNDAHLQLHHANQINSIALTADARMVVTGTNDWTVRLWSIPNTTVPVATIPNMEFVASAIPSDDGTLIAIAGMERIRVWQRREQGIMVGETGWNAYYWKARPGFDGRLATPTPWRECPSHHMIPLNSLTVVEVQSGAVAGPAISMEGIVDSCICNDNLSVAVVAMTGDNGLLTVTDVATGRPVAAPTQLPAMPKSIAARPGHPDVAALCANDQVIVVNQLDGSRLLDLIDESTSKITDFNPRLPRVAYTPDGSTMIVLNSKSEILVRDAQTGQLRFPMIRPGKKNNACCSFAVSNDSRFLATCVNVENAAQVWDLATGIAVSEPLPHPGDGTGMYAVAFSPDGRRILTGNKDGRARLWDWRAGKLACPPLQVGDEVLDLAFTTDGEYAVTAVRKGTLLVWELATGKPVAPPVRYSSKPVNSTNTLALIGTRAIVDADGGGYPVIELGPLLREPTESVESIQAIAELATAGRLQLGEINGLSETEWNKLLEKMRAENFSPAIVAANLAVELDRNNNSTFRLLVADRAARSEFVLDELIRLRPDVPRLHAARAGIWQKRNDPRAAESRLRAIELYERELDGGKLDEPGKKHLAELLFETATTAWHPLNISDIRSRDGAVFSQRGDGAWFVSGNHTIGDTYTLTVAGGKHAIAAIRLDVLPDPKLPYGGQGRHASGNFQLSAFRVFRFVAGNEGSPEPVRISDAWASFTYPAPKINVLGTIDPDRHQVWHVFGRPGQPHSAIYQLDEPLAVDADQSITIELEHFKGVEEPLNLGCFRLSACTNRDSTTRERDRREFDISGVSNNLRLAIAYNANGNAAKAVSIIEHIVASAETTESGVSLMHLVELCDRRGDAADARRYYERFIEWRHKNLFPESLNRRADELMRKIGGLDPDRAVALSSELNVETSIIRLTQAIELNKTSKKYYSQRAFQLARLGKWREAALDLERFESISPNAALEETHAAVMYVLANDHNAWRELVLRMIAKHPTAPYPFVAERICKAALLLPGVIPVAELPVGPVQNPAMNSTIDQNDPWLVSCRSLIALRDGRFQDVIDTGEVPETSAIQPAVAQSLAVRSMALFRLNRLDEARETLKRAEQLIPSENRGIGTEESVGSLPFSIEAIENVWLIPEILRREAASLIDGDAAK